MTVDQVILTIKSMKTKSCELDCVPTDVLKDMLPVIAPMITRIVILSLSNGIFSEQWKTAILGPLLKNWD